MLQADSFPRPPRGGAGVVIAEHAARVVVLRPEGDGFRLSSTEVALPPGCMRCGHVMDPSALREALSTVALIVGGLPTWLGIFPDDTLVQTFDLGAVSIDAAEAELRALAAGFVDYGYVGGWEIHSTATGVSALTVAIPGAHVQRYAAAARLGGLALAGVESTVPALVRGLVHGSAQSADRGGLAVSELGGSRLATAWLGSRAVSGGWLGPTVAGRAPATGRVDVHPAVLDLLAPGARAGFAEGAAGWPTNVGFVQGSTGRIERLVAAVDAEPILVTVPTRLVSPGGMVPLRADGAGTVDPAAWGLALVAAGVAIASVDLLLAAGGDGIRPVDGHRPTDHRPTDDGPVDLSSIAQLTARLAALPTAALPEDDGEVGWTHPVRSVEPPIQVGPAPHPRESGAPERPAPPSAAAFGPAVPDATPSAHPAEHVAPAGRFLTISLPSLDRAQLDTAAAGVRLPDPASFWTSRIGSEAGRDGRAPTRRDAPPPWRSALSELSAPYPAAANPFQRPAEPAHHVSVGESVSVDESTLAFPPRPSAGRRPPVRRLVAQFLGIERNGVAETRSHRVHEEAS